MSGKIDTHQHYLPKVYVDAIGLETLAAMMPSGKAPAWSPEAALAMMDANGIETGVISISSGPFIPDAAHLLRACNEVAAGLREAHPGRFGFFASLPLPDIDASLEEIDYSLDKLKADGFILFTNYAGKYLGDPVFLPVLEELDRRKAVSFIHPNQPPYSLAGQPASAVMEFPFDTTRTAVSLMTSGALRRFPDIKFILSHAGGALPYLSGRISGALMANPATAERVGDPMAAIRSFYFDLALSASPAALAALQTVTDPDHILLGTDFPMAPVSTVQKNLASIAAIVTDEGLRAGISRANAARLLGREGDPIR